MAHAVPLTISRPTRLHTALAEARRVALGVAGPAGMAAAQFAATMALWGRVSAAEFGLFSFASVLLQLSFGVANALVVTPLSLGGDDPAAHRHRCLSAHGLHLLAAGAALAAVAIVAGVPGDAPAFAAMAVAANLRWGARGLALADEQVRRSATSDAIFAAALAVGLGLLLVTGRLDSAALAWTMAAANLLALAVGGSTFLRVQWAAIRAPDLLGYRQHVWPRQAGWALGGVATTELASNAQTYAVTGLYGAAAFAPLALGALFCRPLTVFLSALTQVDRPIFARLRASGETTRAATLLRAALAAAGVTWTGNAALALLVVTLAAGPITARGYDLVQLRWVVVAWFAVMLLRALRNPFATAVQASGAFRALAACSAVAGVVSTLGAGSLALVGPLWSLGGTLIGEAVLLAGVVHLYRRQR